MKRFLPFLLLAMIASAEREVVPAKLTRTGVAADGKLVATPQGFAVKNPFHETSQILLCGEGGKVLKMLEFCEKGERWWLSPNGEVIAVTEHGNLQITWAYVLGGDPVPAELAPDGEISFAADGKTVAFASGKSIVVLRTKPGGKRLEIPRPKNSMIVEGPILSGDGKRLFLLTAPVVDDALDSVVGSPDTIQSCDPTAASPEWKTLVHEDGGLVSHLAASPAGGAIAFTVRKGKGCDLRLVDRDSGASETLSDSTDVQGMAISPDGKRVVVTALGANGRVKAICFGTTREGPHQSFSVEEIGAFADEDVVAAAPDADSCWLLVRKATGIAKEKEEVEVVRSTPR